MPENTKTADKKAFEIPPITWWLFAAATVFVYFFGLTIPLLGPDEPRYAQVAREMFERGDWITPTLGGFNWFEKPALLYWLQIASYNLFGVSEFSARFGSAVFGLGTIFSLWILGRFLATENTEKPGDTEDSQTPSESSVPSVVNDFANWLALIAASTIGIIVFSRGASFDIILTFPMTAALVSFFIFDKGSSNPRARYVALVAFYFFIGVALLAKGLVGIVFPIAIVAFYYLLARRFPSKTFLFSLFWGMLISAIVASFWYVPMYQRHGWTFINEFFIQHHFQRYTSNKYFHPQPFYFFFWVLPLMTIPWLPFFAAAIWDFVSGNFKRRAAETTRNGNSNNSTVDNTVESDGLPFSPSPLLQFAAAWLLVPLVFFSFSGSKLPGYILPAVPAAVIVTGVWLYRFVQIGSRRKVLVQLTAFMTLVVVVCLLVFVVPRFAESDSVKALIEAADKRGLGRLTVVNLHNVSHNAEFYASGRLLRSADGKQKKLLGVAEVLQEIDRRNGEPILVLVPIEHLHQLTESNLVNAEVIRDNGELAIVLASANR